MSFILRRLAFYLVAAWVAITANFFIPRAMPGNPVQLIVAQNPGLTSDAIKSIELELGGVLAKGSLWSQYVTYLGHVFTFNFGPDIAHFPEPVSTELGQAIPWTLILVGVATVIAFLIGTGLGILAGWRHGGWLDRSLPALMFLQAVPYFFLALVLVDVVGIELHWLPTGTGFDGATSSPGWNLPFIGSALQHAILPAFTIVITSIAGWMLQMRNVMITTISEDYVVAAQAKGLPSRRVIYTYAARNALLPQLQGFGLALGFVVSGALVMEIVFAYPGIGLLLLNAVSSDDFPLMQAIFLVIVFAVLVANLVVDLVIVFIDPRVRGREVAR
ncbi:MAG: ABC transporter permease [Trebonia sp.]